MDCSDHEVNIKILLGLVVADGEMTDKQRNALLAEMTDEVGLLVLQDNSITRRSALHLRAVMASNCSTRKRASCATWNVRAA
ncbi:MAG: unnamed protein product [uncultured Paraburkholderia sp.]|nr:MAG: unnamed protein product [uncultured Paraburkholderia sp.]